MAFAQWVRTGKRLAASPILIFAIALGARIRVLWQLLPSHAWVNFWPWNEPSRIAWCLVSGYGYSSPWKGTPIAPTAQQPPVFPLIMTAIFKVTGAYTMPSLWIASVLNATISACSAMVIFRLGRRDFNDAAGILAAWVWAVWLYEAVIAIRLWESSLTALLLVCTLWWLPKLAEEGRWGPWIRFGILAGFSAHTNSTMMAVFPCFYIWLWVSAKRGTLVARKVLIASITVFFVSMVPWTVRNYLTFHRLLPLRDNFGLELWIGNHEGVTAAQIYPTAFPLLDPTEYNQLGEISFMRAKLHLGLEFVRDHPGEFLRLSAYRFVYYWTEPKGSWWFLPSALAWVGMILALGRNPRTASPYAIVMIIFPAVYYITHTFPSYRHPMEPVVLLLAAFALTRIASACSWPFRVSG